MRLVQEVRIHQSSMIKKLLCIFLAIVGILGCKEAHAETGYDNYIEEFADRYAAYARKKKGMAYQDVLVAVNLGLDRPNYKNVIMVQHPQSVAVFVSKHYKLPLQYKPDDLILVDRKYAQSGVRLRKDCYQAFLRMVKDMEQEGMSLYIKAGYRINRKRTKGDSIWYAYPGHSEHQTGLAFDLRKKNVTYKTLGEYDYEKTREYAWLCEHAYRYGFILSYPKGKTQITGFGYEPWHWRYVGTKIATDMKQKGFTTFHEYWATYLIQDAILPAQSAWHPRTLRPLAFVRRDTCEFLQPIVFEQAA